MPAARRIARGIASSAMPSAIEKYPRPAAISSCIERDRPGRAVGGTGLAMIGSIGLQHDLDAPVLLVAERLVHLRSLVERDPVRDDEGGVDLPLENAVQQIVGPAVNVGLAGVHRQALVHQRAERDLVQEAAIDA